MTGVVLCLVAGLFVIAADARAQVAPGSAEGLTGRYIDLVRGLSLEQAMALAIEREPSLRAARTDVDAARGTRRQAALRPNPTVSTERREEPGGTDQQTGVSLQWPLDLFRKAARVAVADRELQASELSVADRERVLASDVRSQYGRLLAAVRELAVSDELVAVIRRQHALLRARVEEGASPPIERDLLDVELRRFEAEQALLIGRADTELFELKRLLGFGPADPLTVRDTLEEFVQRDRTTSPPAGSATDAAAVVRQRPDVREVAARIELAEARIDRARREGRFDVSLFGSYVRMDAGFPQRGFSPTGDLARVRGLFNYVAAGAMVTIPLRDRKQGEIAAAEAARAGAAALHEAKQLAVQSEIASARARDEQARRAVGVYAAGARSLARQNLDVVRQTYALGRATVFDVLAEQRRFLDLERAYTETLREAYDARTALRRALGEVP